MNPGHGGFAALDENEKRRIASMGGKAGHYYGTARKWTPEEAREAGRMGKLRSDEAKRAKRRAAARERGDEVSPV